MTTDMTVQLLVQMRDMASKGLEQLGKTGEKAGEQVEAGASRAGRAIDGIRSGISVATGALATLGVAVSFQSLVSSFKAVNEELDRLKDLSISTGIEVGKLAGIKFAASQLGTDVEAIVASFRRISMAIVEARDPLSDSATMFNALGISLDEIRNARPEDAFFAIMEALGQEGSEAEKNVIANQLLGRSYSDLKLIAAAGRGEFERLTAEQKRLNPVTRESADAADDLGDAWGRTHEAMKGVLASGVIQDISTRMADNLTQILVQVRGALGATREELLKWLFNPAAGNIGGGSQADPEAAKMRGIQQAMDARARAAEEQKRIDLEAAQRAQELARLAAELSKQAQEQITSFLRSELDKRDALSTEGIARIAEREIAEWQKLLDQKLIGEEQFAQARAYINENAQKQIDAMIEKEFAESDKRIHGAAEASNRAMWAQIQSDTGAALKAIEDARRQAAEQAAQIYESTTVAGVQRATAREIAAIEASGAAFEEVQAAKVALARDSAEQIAQIQIAELERTGTSLQGVMQGITDWRKSLGTEFTRARDISKNALTSIQGGLANLIVSAQNSNASISDSFRAMAQSVVASIQRMIAEMIAMQIVQAATGGLGPIFGGFFGGGGGVVSNAPSGGGGVVTNFNASGTRSFGGGWSWVGERGPELIRMPRGTQVRSAHEIAGGGMDGGGGEPVVVQLTINAVDARSVAQLLLQPESQNALKETMRGALARDKGVRNAGRGL